MSLEPEAVRKARYVLAACERAKQPGYHEMDPDLEPLATAVLALHAEREQLRADYAKLDALDDAMREACDVHCREREQLRKALGEALDLYDRAVYSHATYDRVDDIDRAAELHKLLG